MYSNSKLYETNKLFALLILNVNRIISVPTVQDKSEFCNKFIIIDLYVRNRSYLGDQWKKDPGFINNMLVVSIQSDVLLLTWVLNTKYQSLCVKDHTHSCTTTILKCFRVVQTHGGPYHTVIRTRLVFLWEPGILHLVIATQLRLLIVHPSLWLRFLLNPGTSSNHDCFLTMLAYVTSTPLSGCGFYCAITVPSCQTLCLDYDTAELVAAVSPRGG